MKFPSITASIWQTEDMADIVITTDANGITFAIPAGRNFMNWLNSWMRPRAVLERRLRW
jgi:hypothetical protein